MPRGLHPWYFRGLGLSSKNIFIIFLPRPQSDRRFQIIAAIYPSGSFPTTYLLS